MPLQLSWCTNTHDTMEKLREFPANCVDSKSLCTKFFFLGQITFFMRSLIPKLVSLLSSQFLYFLLVVFFIVFSFIKKKLQFIHMQCSLQYIFRLCFRILRTFSLLNLFQGDSNFSSISCFSSGFAIFICPNIIQLPTFWSGIILQRMQFEIFTFYLFCE